MKQVDVRKLAKSLFHEFNLDWHFKFDNARRRAGLCDYKKITISLSKHYCKLNNEHFVKQILLHEIAHALLPIDVGHSKDWKETCRSIGCNDSRVLTGYYVSPRERSKTLYIGTCPRCHRQIKRFRRLNISCGKCSKIYDPALKFIWEKLT